MTDRRTQFGAALVAASSALGFSACGPDDTEPRVPACLADPANADCTMRQYQPENGSTYTFSEIFQQSINGRCNEAPCHDSSEPKGDLDLSTVDTAYEQLLAPSVERVLPGDVQCGAVIVRLETADAWYSMPPNNHLTEPELCVFRQWIASGAPR